MLSSASLPNGAHITGEEIGSKAESPERKLTLTSYKSNRDEDRHRVLLQFGNLYFQFVDSDAYEQEKLLFLIIIMVWQLYKMHKYNDQWLHDKYIR